MESERFPKREQLGWRDHLRRIGRLTLESFAVYAEFWTGVPNDSKESTAALHEIENYANGHRSTE